MIGFGAGVGQMSAIFGLQTCRNELVGGESELVWRNREAVVGAVRSSSISPGSECNMRAEGGRAAAASPSGFIYNVRWGKCSLNATAHCQC